MSKRREERARHDERVAGRNVTINRRIREESTELDCCEECHAPVRVDGMRRCNSCGTLACLKCVKGGHCKFCHEIYGMDPIDLDDDLLDSREVGSPGPIGIPSDSDEEDSDAGDAEINPGNDYNADLDNGGPYPRPTNWDRFSDDMY